MNTFSIAELKDGNYFSKDVFLDQKFLLATPLNPITQDLIRFLKEWDFHKVFSEGDSSESMTDQFTAYIDSEEPESSTDNSETSQSIIGELESDEAIFQSVEKAYYEFQDFISSIYTRYVTKKDLSLQLISNKTKALCDFIKQYRKWVLRIQPSQEFREKNYLVVHSMRSTVFAIVIAQQLKFPIHKQIELGVSSILHEIGMVRLPPQLYMGKKELTPIERNAIFTHPVISYNILREHEFPLNICLGALEHHERENGEGYPRKLTKEKISIYAKIIAVACSYEAITAPRPYKEARDAFSGIIDLMKNSNKQYDDTIVKALLFSLSLYPIGIHVLLSDGKKGQVVDVNPENPKYPVVKVHGELRADGTPRIVETSEYGVAIARPLTVEERATLAL